MKYLFFFLKLYKYTLKSVLDKTYKKDKKVFPKVKREANPALTCLTSNLGVKDKFTY
jgi:hypothetical protein